MSVHFGKKFFLPNHKTQEKGIDWGDVVYNVLAVIFTSVPNHFLLLRTRICALCYSDAWEWGCMYNGRESSDFVVMILAWVLLAKSASSVIFDSFSSWAFVCCCKKIGKVIYFPLGGHKNYVGFYVVMPWSRASMIEICYDPPNFSPFNNL